MSPKGNKLLCGVNVNYLNSEQRLRLQTILPAIFRAGLSGTQAKVRMFESMAKDIFDVAYRTYKEAEVSAIRKGTIPYVMRKAEEVEAERRLVGAPPIRPPGAPGVTPSGMAPEAPSEPGEPSEEPPEAPEVPEEEPEGPRGAVGKIVPKPKLSREPEGTSIPSAPNIKRTRGGEKTSAQRRKDEIGSFKEITGRPKVDDVKPEPLAVEPESDVKPSEKGDLKPRTDPTVDLKPTPGLEKVQERKTELPDGKPGTIKASGERPGEPLTSPQRRGVMGAVKKLGSKVASLFKPSKK